MFYFETASCYVVLSVLPQLSLYWGDWWLVGWLVGLELDPSPVFPVALLPWARLSEIQGEPSGRARAPEHFVYAALCLLT